MAELQKAWTGGSTVLTCFAFASDGCKLLHRMLLTARPLGAEFVSLRLMLVWNARRPTARLSNLVECAKGAQGR